MNLVLVFCGGGLGSLARYLSGVAYLRAFGPSQPYLATLAINVVGGALMGVLVGYLTARGSPDERLRLFVGVGLLGGFTTFSTFSLEAWLLIERRAYATAAGYIGVSVALAIAGLGLGLFLSRRAFG